MDVLLELRELRKEFAAVEKLDKFSAPILRLEIILTEQFGRDTVLMRQIDAARKARFVAVGDTGWDSGVKHMQRVALQVTDAAIATLDSKLRNEERARASHVDLKVVEDELDEIIESGLDHPQAALVCVNGHLLSSISNGSDVDGFCPECGGARMTSCGACKADIPGQTHRQRGLKHAFKVPNFCISCGRAYEWTNRRIQSIAEIAELAEGLTPREREALEKNLAIIVLETPDAVPAAHKVKLLALKGGKELASSIVGMAVEFASARAREVLLGAP